MEIMQIYTLYNIAIKLVRHSHWCLFNFNSIRCVFYFTLRNRNLHTYVSEKGGWRCVSENTRVRMQTAMITLDKRS